MFWKTSCLTGLDKTVLQGMKEWYLFYHLKLDHLISYEKSYEKLEKIMEKVVWQVYTDLLNYIYI
jgi:hypothetical protein